MTDEEIKKIYNHLHENYNYDCDGHLIHKFDLLNKSKLKGEKLGSFFYHTKSNPYLMSSVTINKKRYRMKLIKLIFIYHKKYLPSHLYQIDKNPMNTRIENLQEITHSLIKHRKILDKKLTIPKFKNKDGTEGYNVRVMCGGKSLNLGTYRTNELGIEVYTLAKKLFLDNGIPANEIKKIIANKYPESSLNKISVTKYKGVSVNKNKFIAQIGVNGKKKYLGSFSTPEEAHAAYLKAKEEHAKNT